MPSPFAVRDPEEIELVDRLFKEGRPLNGSADSVTVELRNLALRRGRPYKSISEDERRYWVDSGGKDAPPSFLDRVVGWAVPVPTEARFDSQPPPTAEQIKAMTDRLRTAPVDPGMNGPPGDILNTVVGRALPGAVGYTAGKYLGWPHSGDWDKEKQAQALSKWAGSGDAYPVDLIESAAASLPPVYGTIAAKNAYDFLSETDGNAWKRIQQDPARAAQLLMDTAVMLHGGIVRGGSSGPEVRAPETEAGPILTREGIKQRIGQLRDRIEGNPAVRGDVEPPDVRAQAQEYIDRAPLPEAMKAQMKAFTEEPGTRITLPDESGAVPHAGTADLPEPSAARVEMIPELVELEAAHKANVASLKKMYPDWKTNPEHGGFIKAAGMKYSRQRKEILARQAAQLPTEAQLAPAGNLPESGFAPGAQVVHPESGRTGTVIRQEGNQVRIKPNDGDPTVYRIPASDLQPVPTARSREEVKASLRAKWEGLQQPPPSAATPPAAPLPEVKGNPLAAPDVPPAATPSPGGVRPASDVFDVPLDDLHLDPNRFQYKRDIGKGGVTNKLKKVKVWNNAAAGIIHAWRDPADGLIYVVNGHHRYELAQRLRSEGEPVPDSLRVMLIDAPNAKAARLQGALLNIADESASGTAFDAASIFREHNLTPDDLAARGVPLTNKTASDGFALASLNDALWDAAVRHHRGDPTGIPLDQAIVLGKAGLSDAQQTAAFGLLHDAAKKGKEIDAEMVGDVAQIVKNSGTAQGGPTAGQIGLFGGADAVQSTAIEKAELAKGIRKMLGREKFIFGVAGNNAEELARVGNIDAAQSGKIAKEAGLAKDIFNQNAHVSGPISDILNRGALRVAQGEPLHVVRGQIYTEIKEELRSLIGGGEGRDLPGSEGSPGSQPSLLGEGGEGATGSLFGDESPPVGPLQAEGVGPAPGIEAAQGRMAARWDQVKEHLSDETGGIGPGVNRPSPFVDDDTLALFLQDVKEIGAHHAAAGLRTFEQWSQAVYDDLAEISPEMADFLSPRLPAVWQGMTSSTTATGGPSATTQAGTVDDPLFLSDVVTPVPRPEPIDPADYEVLIQKFNMDPAGERRLRQQLAGVQIPPRQKITLEEQGRQARLLADRLGIDRKTFQDDDLALKTNAKRLSGVEINALMDTVGDNLELIERVSPKLNDATARVEEIEQARQIIDAATQQNNALLGKIVSARSQTGRDLGSLRLLAKQSTDPAVWLAMAKRNLGGRVLSEEMAERITRLAREAQEACR